MSQETGWKAKRAEVLSGIAAALLAHEITGEPVPWGDNEHAFGGRFQHAGGELSIKVERWGRRPFGARDPDPRPWCVKVGASGQSPRTIRERKATGFDFAVIAAEVASRFAEARATKRAEAARKDRGEAAAAVSAKLGLTMGDFWRRRVGFDVVELFDGGPARPLVLHVEVAVNEEQAAAVIAVLRERGLVPEARSEG